LDNIIHNILLSLLWGFAIFFATLKDRDTETSALAGVVAFLTVFAVLGLLVDKEFSEENAVFIKAIVWTMGAFLAGVVLCQMALIEAL
jgi:hypothetical protein